MTPARTRNILITSALPYANGSIHIGHLVEYIQTDIFVRVQKLRGHAVTYVCGDDSHGTPIMLKAQQEGSTPEAYIARFHQEHKEDFARFAVAFDNYYTTHSDINRDISYAIYDRVKAAGIIAVKEIEQLFDPQANIFLPDRFIKGTCPFCKTPDQYGDSCDNCDKTFDPADLINPVSVVSGATPVLKKSRHLFLQLESSRELLLKLYEAGLVDDAVKNKLLDWFKEPLRDWDISRDAPFFGFPIPGEEGKFFYNWFDAPIGYLASLGNLLGKTAAETLDYWNQPDHEIIHFIGKDIQYFHALFWPVMLARAGLRTPTKIAIHGHLTVNGRKMSKRDGTFIKASTFAKHLDPQWLRYYYATKLGPTPEDLDLSLEDFVNRVNSELVGKLANLISRAAPMVTRLLDGTLGVPAADSLALLNEIRAAADTIADAYEGRNFALATRQICALADKANKYFDEQAPWKLVKTDAGGAEAARGVLTATLEAGRILTIYLKPILPDFAAKVEKCLQIPALEWKHIQDSMPAQKIGHFEHLVARIEMKAVQAMIEESKESGAGLAKQILPNMGKQTPEELAALANLPTERRPHEQATSTQSSVLRPQSSSPTPPGMHPAEEPLTPTCNIDQFMAIDLRIARVLTAEAVEKSDKLMKFTVDLGHLGQRTILAGIKNAYTPERLVGRLVVVCANLAPRKMGKFGTSEGMVLASGLGGPDVYVLSPDSGAKPGQRVH